MAQKETGMDVYEWRIENFSHFCARVPDSYIIKSPVVTYKGGCRLNMRLFPKGMRGAGEHLVVMVHGNHSFPSTGELSFFSSDGTLLCPKQQVTKGNDSPLPPGPKFEDVLSKIREGGEDFIVLELRIKGSDPGVKRVCTTINVLKISLEIDPKWIGNMKSNETKDVFYILLSPDEDLGRMWLEIRCVDNALQFTVTPPLKGGCTFSVGMCVRLTGSDVDGFVREKYVLHPGSRPWTCPDSLDKRESAEKGISLFLCLNTRDSIQSPIYMSCANSCVSIESTNKICFLEKVPTRDSAIQTSVISDMAGYSALLLSKELMRLYRDQDLSDITLKCDNVTFPVHRAILSARSPVFKSMLSTDMAEASSGEVDIEDMEPSTLSRFLTYLYTGALEEDLQCGSAVNLYYAADKYQVLCLKRDCSKFLGSIVSLSTVCDILSLADRHNDDELVSVAHDFILDNFTAVLKSEEWGNLKKNEPVLVAETVTQFAVEGRVRKHFPQ